MPAGKTDGPSAAAPPAANSVGPVVLIGPMAVGKSAIGQQLAEHLGCAFMDTDALVVAQHGTIAEIFASRGEHADSGVSCNHVHACRSTSLRTSACGSRRNCVRRINNASTACARNGNHGAESDRDA